MLQNEWQRKVAVSKLEKLTRQLEQLENDEEACTDRGLHVVLAQTRQSIEDLERDIKDFSEAQNVGLVDMNGLGDLGPALIRARLAQGLNQKQLAEMSGLQESAIARYEKRQYEQASLQRVQDIAGHLGFKLPTVGVPIETAATA